ncbi:hypothetical protein AVEN_235864-1 [Araneus ventricosus]|uniref:Uncharacterized protein n=1 Tax=Araneus ventricosus TaxID=182803 RepID=A0A4Y2UU84_ARAVE|nr:hypothetical protein AVEN_235864-1 [Araneus ventricosus]
MVHAARWYIPLCPTGSTRRLMVHSSESHRLYAPPEGTFKCETPVVHAAQWHIQVRTTAGARSPMVHSSVGDPQYAPPDGTFKCDGGTNVLNYDSESSCIWYAIAS